MPYCGNCGRELTPNAKFCGVCGARQDPAASQSNTAVQSGNVQPYAFVPPPPPPPPQSTAPQMPTANYSSAQWPQRAIGEQVVGTLLLRKPKSLGRYDTFTGVLTDQRFIIAQMTSDMLKDAAMQAREQAKAEGKGFWGQWSDQLKATFGYTKKYLTMQPQAILAETPGNFAINNQTIIEIRVNLKHLANQDNRHELEVEIHSSGGKYEYRMDDDSNFTDLLKRVHGEKVKMPLGYFSKTIRIGF